jgi:circadian clock protein KaiC
MNTEFLKTGIDGLDEILRGGILPSSSILLEGGPGTGKTIFSLQFIYKSNEPSIILSFNNTENELFNYAKNFNWNFYNLKKQKKIFVITDIVKAYKDIFNFKNSQIHKIIKRYNIKRIVIDSVNHLFKASQDYLKSNIVFSLFLKALKDEGIVILIVKERDTLSELNYLVDIVIKIDIKEISFKRILTVTKSKINSFFEGEHLLKITNNGLKVYINLNHFAEKLLKKDFRSNYEREEIGINELDETLGGGLSVGEVLLVGGPSGIGKTLIALKFLKKGIDTKEKTLYIGFNVSINNLEKKANLLNFDLKNSLYKGNLEILNITDDLFVEEVINKIYELLSSNIKRVVIDEIGKFAKITTDFYKVILILKNMFLERVTLFTLNIGENLNFNEQEIYEVMDYVVLMKYVEIENMMKKVVYVLKANTKDYDKSVRELIINNDGIYIGNKFETYQSILSGSATKVDIKLITIKSKSTEEIISDFQKVYPNVKVEILDIPHAWEEISYIKEKITNNRNIGVIPLGFNTVQSLAKAKLLLELDNVLDNEDKKRFFSVGLDGCSSGGHLYAIPDDIKCELLVYRKDLLKKYGFEPPKTWNDLVEQTEFIIKRENNTDLCGISWSALNGSNLVNEFLTFLYSNGGDIYRKDGKLGLLEKSFLETVEFMYDLIYKFNLVSKDVLKLSREKKIQKLCQGNQIFFLCPSNMLSEIFKNTKYELGIIPFPLGPNGKENLIAVWGFAYAIPKWGLYPQTSLELLKFFTSFENQKRVELSGGSTFPARKNICLDKEILRNKPYYKNAIHFLEEVKTKNIFKTPYFEKIFPLLREVIWDILNNRIKIDGGLKDVDLKLKNVETKPNYSYLVNSTINFLEENLHKPLKLTDISNHLRLSPYHLSRVFKSETKKTIFEYLLHLRIEKAKRLLRNIQLNISEISRECGFNDANYFTRVFKKNNGISPTEYRMKVL